MLDSNLNIDQQKLSYIAHLPYGGEVIRNAVQEHAELSIEEVSDNFGVKQLLNPENSQTFVTSLLYYIGALTLGRVTEQGKISLHIPNMVAHKLYIEQIQRLLVPNIDKGQAIQAAETLFNTGNIEPVCAFIEQTYFSIFDNRDYRWTNELTIKTLFLTLLFNDLWYIMDSESALQRTYADLVMIVRPDMRRFQLLDLLFEFKYISLNDLKLNATQIREQDIAELAALPEVQQQFAVAKSALQGYRNTLNSTYANTLRLHNYAVVAIGFERLLWEKLS